MKAKTRRAARRSRGGYVGFLREEVIQVYKLGCIVSIPPKSSSRTTLRRARSSLLRSHAYGQACIRPTCLAVSGETALLAVSVRSTAWVGRIPYPSSLAE